MDWGKVIEDLRKSAEIMARPPSSTPEVVAVMVLEALASAFEAGLKVKKANA